MRLTLPGLPSEKRADEITRPASTVGTVISRPACTVLYCMYSTSCAVTAISRVLSPGKYGGMDFLCILYNTWMSLRSFCTPYLCVYVLPVQYLCVYTFLLYLHVSTVQYILIVLYSVLHTFDECTVSHTQYLPAIHVCTVQYIFYLYNTGHLRNTVLREIISQSGSTAEISSTS
jgi:hypothetical protein